MQVQLKPWGNSQGIRFSKEFLNYIEKRRMKKQKIFYKMIFCLYKTDIVQQM